jgi:hypothetical protein
MPKWVNWRGEPIDPTALRRAAGAIGDDVAAAGPSAARQGGPTFEPSDAERDRVFRAAVLAGGPRSKGWLGDFLHHLGLCTDRGTR